jgi:hypothetical protein
MTVPVDVSIPFKNAKQNVISEFERRYISRLLAQHDGNISAALPTGVTIPDDANGAYNIAPGVDANGNYVAPGVATSNGVVVAPPGAVQPNTASGVAP